MAKAGLLFVGTDDGLVMFSDPGASGRWLRVGHELRGNHMRAVWPLFDNPVVILAGADTGLWRSENGGASWSNVLSLDILKIHGEKDTPLTVYLYTSSGHTFRSDSGGDAWHETDTALVAGAAQSTILGGRDPVILVSSDRGIERSEDNGATWMTTSADQPWNGAITVISPARYHIDTAFAGTTSGQLATSTDRGRTWRVLRQDLPSIRDIVATRLA
jgi:photosystem II stability/assembly factor-like uncharacterized protein